MPTNDNPTTPIDEPIEGWLPIERQVDWPIEVRPNGTVMYDGIAIGGLDYDVADTESIVATGKPRLTLNLGWIRAAGLRIKVLDDPAVERHRDGITLDR